MIPIFFTTGMKKIFIVEDQEDVRFIYANTIAKRFTDVVVAGEAATGEDALITIPDVKPDLIIVDVSLPGMDGIELVRQLHEKDPYLKILVMTGYERDLLQESAIAAGAEDILEKGNLPAMVRRIAEILNVELHPKSVRARS